MQNEKLEVITSQRSLPLAAPAPPKPQPSPEQEEEPDGDEEETADLVAAGTDFYPD